METFEENGKVIPYCLCILLEDREKSFYYGNSDVIEKCFFYIIKKSIEKNVVIYIHNLNFDGILLIEYFTINKINFKIKALKTNLY